MALLIDIASVVSVQLCCDYCIMTARFDGSSGSATFLYFLSIGSFDGGVIGTIFAAAEMVLLCAFLDCCFCQLAA